MTKETFRRPSEVTGLDKTLYLHHGLEDWWVTYQFDEAVIYWGVYVENKLNETDDKGKLVNSLENLLSEPRRVSAAEFVARANAMFGGG